MADTQQRAAGRIKISWVVLAVLILAGVLYAVLHHSTYDIRTEQVVRQNLVSAISTNGKVEPVTNFEAHAPASVAVRQVLVREGESVRKGQLLVRLDDAQARAQAARAQAQLKAAQAENSAVQAGGTGADILNLQDQLNKAEQEQ